MADVKLFKIKTGELVIAEVVDDQPDHVIVNHPLRVVIVPPQGPAPEQQGGIALQMWMPCEPGACKLNRPFLAEATCVSPLANEYLSKFANPASGIVTPPEKKLVVPG